jgi:hypothetical protein
MRVDGGIDNHDKKREGGYTGNYNMVCLKWNGNGH